MNISDAAEPPPQYDRLVKSLSSGLVNEVDFALNACAISSSPGPWSLRLDETTHAPLVTHLVAQAGVFDDDDAEFMRAQFLRAARRLGRDFEHFWRGVGIKNLTIRRSLALDDNVDHHHDAPSTSRSSGNTAAMHHHHHDNDDDQPCYFASLRDVGREQRAIDTVVYRVHQVSQIVRNLAFESANQPTLVANAACTKQVLFDHLCRF